MQWKQWENQFIDMSVIIPNAIRFSKRRSLLKLSLIKYIRRCDLLEKHFDSQTILPSKLNSSSPLMNIIQSFRFVKSILRSDNSNKLDLLLDISKLNFHRLFSRQNSGFIKLKNFDVYYGDIDLLVHLYKEVFISNTYSFNSETDNPIIIDAGANIGMATLFFKKLYPKSVIKCFEPDSQNFSYLQKNVSTNNLENVELYNVALSDRKGTMSMYIQTDITGGDIGASTLEDLRYFYHKPDNVKKVDVPCCELNPLISERVELLKMDIEGAESVVFENIQERIAKVENIIMEYHYLQSKNSLAKILQILENNSFFYRIIGIDDSTESYTLIIKAHKKFSNSIKG